MAEIVAHNGEVRLRVGVDEPTHDVELVMRWREDATPIELINSLAHVCGAAAEALTKYLAELGVSNVVTP